MADERYEWLDKDAAERLLRGEPVDPVGGRSCTDAERLVAALDAARATRPATGELPGEAAALTAFRTASRSARAKTRADARAAGAEDGRPAGAEALDPVSIEAAAGGSVPRATALAASRRTRPSRWSRPVRFGLVASLAGCALGGVAVAAGTGMLPGPFGGHTPLPAASVSAAATPEELGSGVTTDETAQPPSASPSTGTSTSPGDPSAPAGDQDHGSSGRATDPGGGDKRKPGGAATGSPGGSRNGEQPENPGNGDSAEWYAKALQACRDYRDGKLSEKRRRKLEALANGAENLDRFCDRMIERAEEGQGHQGGDSGDEQNGGGSNGNNGSDSDSASDAASRTPSSIRFAHGVRLTPAPVSPTPSARTPGAGVGALG
ncbi:MULTISPECIES: hypothetical protein [unclassified Streptomyces]|uniref:hypothetical protein n=1 Tax=unclassified Streptomyces TaxID=2593676 RepID=UPI00324E1961